jgi:hypothetical protein
MGTASPNGLWVDLTAIQVKRFSQQTTLLVTPSGGRHMRRSLSVIANLAVLLTLGCVGGANGTAAPSAAADAVVNTCAVAHKSNHVAYLIVEHLSGQTIERCAGFDGDAIDGGAVMRATAIQYQADGTAMCQVDREPAQVSGCSSEQAHWSLWMYGGGEWTQPTVAYTELQLHDREALGWRYVISSVASPPPTPRPL